MDKEIGVHHLTFGEQGICQSWVVQLRAGNADDLWYYTGRSFSQGVWLGVGGWSSRVVTSCVASHRRMPSARGKVICPIYGKEESQGDPGLDLFHFV